MLLACLALGIMNFIISKTTGGHDLDSSRTSLAPNVPNGGARRPISPDSAEPATGADIRQANNDAGVEIMRDALKPWYREALRDPSFRKVQIHYNAQMREQYYMDAYKLLDIDDATSEALRELLGERSVAINESRMDGLESPDAQVFDISGGRMEETRLEYDKKIAGLLGQEKYAMFGEYENSMMQRNQIRQFREGLEFSGQPLTLEQEMALLPALERVSDNDALASRLNKALSRIDPTYTAYTVKITDNTLDAVNEILGEAQIETLAGLQKKQINLNSINYPWKGMGTRMRAAK
jgi:hypothetical protein